MCRRHSVKLAIRLEHAVKNMIRRYFGGLLVVFGQLAIWAGRTLFRLGVAVMPGRSANASLRRSQSRLGVLVPYTVETRDGRHITLYGIRGK